MEDFPENLKNLYMEFGQVAEIAQVMEFEAGNLAFSIASLAFNPTTISNDDRRLLQEVMKDVNRQTFGNLLKQIRKFGNIDKGIEDSIYQALEKRNYLIHKFFSSHNFAIHSKEGREAMRAELREISKILSRAHVILSGMTSTLNKIFDRPDISEEKAIELEKKGQRLNI
jgi:hypothetical protein